jgi:hypothetical protein
MKTFPLLALVAIGLAARAAGQPADTPASQLSDDSGGDDDQDGPSAKVRDEYDQRKNIVPSRQVN